jgi:hypothetical protein
MFLVVEHRIAHAACNLGCGIVCIYPTWSVLYLLLNVLEPKALEPGMPLTCAVVFPH